MWSCTCIVLLVMLSFVEREHARQYCTAVHVNIQNGDRLFFLTEADIFQMLPKALSGNFPKLPLEELQGTRQLEQRINDNPYVKQSEVFVDVNGELHIEVVPMRPIARVFNKLGKSYYIDVTGQKMPLLDKYTAKVPVVTNFSGDQGKTSGEVSTELETELFAFLQMIDKDPFFRALVSQIELLEEGFTIVPIVGNFDIDLGGIAGMQTKLRQIKAFYTKGLGREDVHWDEFVKINSQQEGLAGAVRKKI